jgi:hypothetical protein
VTSARIAIAPFFAAIALAGCGGSDAEPVDAAALEGTWEYELTYDYLVESGIGTAQAEAESGSHAATLESGAFKDRWKTAEGRVGTCSGNYTIDGATVVFKWTEGCWGDWEMKPEIEGNEITWTDIEALPPYDADEDQKVNEVFNSVPWTRVGDAS